MKLWLGLVLAVEMWAQVGLPTTIGISGRGSGGTSTVIAGDVTGTLGASTVVKLRGLSLISGLACASDGYVLTWVAASSNFQCLTSASTTPGSPTSSIQYNNAGSFGGMSGTTWTNASRTLELVDALSTSVLYLSADPAQSGPQGESFSFNTNSAMKPSAVATATGTDGGNVIFNAPAGGNTSIVTTGSGGFGGTAKLRGGSGGRPTAANTSATGGDGGPVELTGGSGATTDGLGTNVAGAGGGVFITAGDGGGATNGMSNTAGAGGNVEIQLGTAGTATTPALDGTVKVIAGGNASNDLQEWTTNGGSVLSKINGTGSFTNLSLAFASLGSPSNGTTIYCSDCTVTSSIDNTCAASGSGAFAGRTNGAWKCQP